MVTNVAKAYFKLAEGQAENAVELSLYYALGGHNYFTSSASTRGLYLSASPCTMAKPNAVYQSIKYQMFRGSKILLEEMTRFSQKKASQYSATGSEAVQLFYAVCDNLGLIPLYDENGKLVVEER